MQTPTTFSFTIGQQLAITCSAETGECISRSESGVAEPQYLLRYKAGDGRAIEAWWSQSALSAELPCETCGGRGSYRPPHSREATNFLDCSTQSISTAELAAVTAACAEAVERRASASTSADLNPPAIGTAWPSQGGIYAGLARGADGAPDHHLILCQLAPVEVLSWGAALDWAAAIVVDGQHDWSLPTRAESALLFANLRDQFAPRWHWTSEQYSRAYAWSQSFGDGFQHYTAKSYEARARAVRRLVIQSLSHS